MTIARSVLFALVPILGLWAVRATSQSPQGRVLVLEDFEQPQASARWTGPLESRSGRASHGSNSARVRLDGHRAQISSTHLAGDWSGYDRLLFDVYSESETVSQASIRIYDAVGGTAATAPRNEYFDGGEKILLLNGWNHVEVKLTPLTAATFQRDMALDRIRELVLSFELGSTAVLVDNLRLVSGVEPAATKSREAPQDAVSIIDNRWITSRQTAPPGGCTGIGRSGSLAQRRRAGSRPAQENAGRGSYARARNHLCRASPGDRGSGPARQAPTNVVQQ